MSKVGIRSIGLAVPDMYVSQATAYEEFRRNFKLRTDEEALYRKILVENDAIDGRYIAMRDTAEVVELDQDQLIKRFAREGRKLGSMACQRAIQQAGYTKEDITGLIVNTCTGYLCPGLTSYLVEDMGLRSDIRVRDIAGMGCGGALPNLDSAAGMINQDPEAVVLSVSIEICTATLFMGSSPDLVVSNSIFGDGASAVVVDGRPEPKARILDFASGLYPMHRDDLRYRTEEHRLRNVLSKTVPIIAGRKVKEVLDNLLAKQGMSREQLDFYALHPGGTQILDRVQRDLELDRSKLKASHDILREYGNMSSPTVIYVLDRIIEETPPKTGQTLALLSFGAGFSVFATLLEFC